MPGILISTTLAGSGYYGQNLFGLFIIIFFNKRELGGCYLLIEEIMATRHVVLTKRETHVGMGRGIVRAHDEKMWKDEETQEKKNWHSIEICGHFDFGYLKMQKDE
jgi:hypothetical protein